MIEGGGPAERFFAAAREAHGEGRTIAIERALVLDIAGDAGQMMRFRRLAREVNDQELRDLIVIYLSSLVKDENRRGRSADLWADNIKLGVGGVGIGTVVAGVAAIAAAGATGGLVLVLCGFGGAALALGGHSFFKSRSNRAKDAVEDIGSLIEGLRAGT